MEGVTAVFLVFWTLIFPSSSGKAWPTHTVCRDGNLEVFYQSCDPLQDFGFSIDQCSKHLKSNLNIRFGIILREDIKELFLDIALFTKGSSILNFSYPVCEEDLPKFSFCGRRKGEQIYYAGPINNLGLEIPEEGKGSAQLRHRLYAMELMEPSILDSLLQTLNKR
uniref:Lymphocyte antigen 86 n=1 Tax=Suricata suricatta TaxID=37032 RepID=A0A673URT5_SURSU